MRYVQHGLPCVGRILLDVRRGLRGLADRCEYRLHRVRGRHKLRFDEWHSDLHDVL